MNEQDFKEKLDNREFWGVNNKEMFDVAHKWADNANKNSTNTCKWSWDCGLKLDYDGELCCISSRFYPPHKNSEDYGKYNGNISVYVLNEKIHTHEIEADTLENLKSLVEKYVLEIEDKIKSSINSIF